MTEADKKKNTPATEKTEKVEKSEDKKAAKTDKVEPPKAVPKGKKEEPKGKKEEAAAKKDAKADKEPKEKAEGEEGEEAPIDVDLKELLKAFTTLPNEGGDAAKAAEAQKAATAMVEAHQAEAAYEEGWVEEDHMMHHHHHHHGHYGHHHHQYRGYNDWMQQDPAYQHHMSQYYPPQQYYDYGAGSPYMPPAHYGHHKGIPNAYHPPSYHPGKMGYAMPHMPPPTQQAAWRRTTRSKAPPAPASMRSSIHVYDVAMNAVMRVQTSTIVPTAATTAADMFPKLCVWEAGQTCPNRVQCPHVHVVPSTTLQPTPIHAAANAANIPRHPAGRSARVYDPHQREFSTEVTSDHILRTVGSDEWHADPNAGLRVYHCAHFLAKGVCHRGGACTFFHVVDDVDASTTDAVTDAMNGQPRAYDPTAQPQSPTRSAPPPTHHNKRNLGPYQPGYVPRSHRGGNPYAHPYAHHYGHHPMHMHGSPYMPPTNGYPHPGPNGSVWGPTTFTTTHEEEINGAASNSSN